MYSNLTILSLYGFEDSTAGYMRLDSEVLKAQCLV